MTKPQEIRLTMGQVFSVSSGKSAKKKSFFEEVWEKKLTINGIQTFISYGSSLPRKRINPKK